MSVQNEVDLARKDIRTDDYPMSIGEWVSMYEEGELDIHPEFQRFYRWSDQQKSNLIESILLGIPIPPIFVSQREDGIWDVIDGLQRLSTIFQFMGILKDEKGALVSPLTLKKTKYLPSLEGLSWENGVSLEDEQENEKQEEVDGRGTLPVSLKRIIKRSKIHVSIVLKESDDNTKYELFERLNTGGSQLSAQEVRNCILVMVNKSFYSWLDELRNFEPFQQTIALSDKLLLEAYDMEQVLRFIILTEAPEEELSKVGDVGAYFNEKMVIIAKDQNFEKEKWSLLFQNTFSKLHDAVGENAFKRFNIHKGRHEGGFLVSQFETVACGVAWNLDRGTIRQDLDNAIKIIWSDDDFTNWAASGITAARRLRRLVPFARRHFSFL